MNKIQQQKHRTLALHPHLQPQQIAEHYLKLATVAMELKILCRFPDSGELDKVKKHLVDTIKETHLSDFGIPLEWDTPDTSSIEHVWRDDGVRFSRNQDGLFSMSGGLHAYTIDYLLSTGKFSTEPPNTP